MTIVAAVDRTDRSKQVIREAEALAKAFEESIKVIHVLSRTEFIDLGRTKAENREVVDMDQIESVAKKIAQEAADEIEVDAEFIGVVGEPATRIIQYANEQDAQYIVVAGRKRTPTGKALFGSVTQSVLLNSDCPVVTTIS